MNEKERIEKIMQVESMTSGQFAQEIGVQNSTLSHILNNRNNPSLDVIKKILNRFPIINSDWLILGQGPMLRQESHSQMPTLFSFDDESDSLSNDLKDNVSKNTYHNFSSNETEEDGFTIESPSRQTFLTNELLKGVEDHTQKSESSNELISEQILNPQDKKLDLKNTNSLYSSKRATKIILYFSDNTFQEFESK